MAYRLRTPANSAQHLTVTGLAVPPGPWQLDAEQVAELGEESVPGASQSAKPKGILLGEARPVPGEEHRARSRLESEEPVDAQPVVLGPGGQGSFEHSILGVPNQNRVASAILVIKVVPVGGPILADEPQEDGPGIPF